MIGERIQSSDALKAAWRLYGTPKASGPPEVEVSLALFLKEGRLLGFSVAGSGASDWTPLQAGRALREALVLGAESLVFLHNHPEGFSLFPSAADLSAALNLRGVCRFLTVELEDFAIVRTDGSELLSFKTENLWEYQAAAEAPSREARVLGAVGELLDELIEENPIREDLVNEAAASAGLRPEAWAFEAFKEALGARFSPPAIEDKRLALFHALNARSPRRALALAEEASAAGRGVSEWAWERALEALVRSSHRKQKAGRKPSRPGKLFPVG